MWLLTLNGSPLVSRNSNPCTMNFISRATSLAWMTCSLHWNRYRSGLSTCALDPPGLTIGILPPCLCFRSSPISIRYDRPRDVVVGAPSHGCGPWEGAPVGGSHPVRRYPGHFV